MAVVGEFVVPFCELRCFFQHFFCAENNGFMSPFA